MANTILAETIEGGGTSNASSLVILAGDLNFQSTEEVDRLASKGFIDTITTSEMTPKVESRESATIGVTFPILKHKSRRSDFILFKALQWKCTHHDYFGNKPIRDGNGDAVPCEAGRNEYLYPSDHLGVIAQFRRIY
jgi:hypothetical protein